MPSARVSHLIFLDTEFTRLPVPFVGYVVPPQLVSIALVTEGGEEFYAESNEFLRRRCSTFVKNTVIPLLTGPAYGRADLRDRLNAFLATQPEGSEIVCDFPVDYMLLVAAAGGTLPQCIKPEWRDVTFDKDSAFEEAVRQYFARGNPAHHALHDARALRLGYLATLRAACAN